MELLDGNYNKLWSVVEKRETNIEYDDICIITQGKH